jgi:heavy metal translocating P-type ATPase
MSACCHTTDDVPTNSDHSREWLMIGIAAIIAAQSMAFGIAINLSPPEGLERVILHSALAAAAVIVFCLVGFPVVRASWTALRARRIVVDQLFLAGIVGAFAASVQSTISGSGSVYYEVVAVLLAIHTIGNVLSRRHREGATHAAQRLREEFSQARRVTCCGSTEFVEIDKVMTGDKVRVLSGEGVPVDGRIVDGSSYVSETTLNGELFPVVKRPGDEVLAGSIIEDGVLTIQASAPGNHRRLDEMLTILSEAASQKAAVQREADRIVSWFLPLVITLSLAAFIVWTAIHGWQFGLFTAMAVLLVSCPCAMGLATPIGIWGALNELARRGVVLKSGDALEALATVDTVVFDKTGTLSEESYSIVDGVMVDGFNREKVRRQVSALQNCSAHPIARAFAEWSGPAPDGVAQDFHTIPGVGISGWVGGSQIEAGNLSLIRDDKARTTLETLREELPSANDVQEFVVLVDGSLAMLVQAREKLRSAATTTVQRLAKWKIPVWIMTGDPAWNPQKLHGVDPSRVLTGLTAQEKADRVTKLAGEGRRVLFVGDGANDALAMAASHTSLALAGGSGVSRSTAHGEIYGGEISRIPETINICRRTIRAIRTNLLFAATYNVCGIVLAASGWLHPVVAALLMLGSSLTVTIRALAAAPANRNPESESPEEQIIPSAPQRPRIAAQREDAITATCFVVQGAAIAALGGMSWPMYAPCIAIAIALVLILYFCRPLADRFTRDMVRLASLGGLAMLAGWWVDAGFMPVVRDGACMCRCAKSDLGWGLIMNFRWMDATMLMACFALFIGSKRLSTGSMTKWLTCAISMLAGMKLSALPIAFLPITNPHMTFVLTYIAMLFGMLLGVIVHAKYIAARRAPPDTLPSGTDQIEATA